MKTDPEAWNELKDEMDQLRKVAGLKLEKEGTTAAFAAGACFLAGVAFIGMTMVPDNYVWRDLQKKLREQTAACNRTCTERATRGAEADIDLQQHVRKLYESLENALLEVKRLRDQPRVFVMCSALSAQHATEVLNRPLGVHMTLEARHWASPITDTGNSTMDCSR